MSASAEQAKASLRVDVVDRAYAARITILSSEEEGAEVPRATAEQCEANLAAAGVVFGIDHEALRQLVELGIPDRATVVARGVRPQRGKDAEITFFFSVERVARPRERADGSVDYYDLGLVENVPSGHLLARKKPATRGRPGMTVLGDEAEGLLGKDVVLRPGANVALTEDGLEASSLAAGHPVWEKGNRVSVHPIYRVAGDVDFGTGNIEFIGTVHVRGSVAPTFAVRAEGDVQVGGSSSAECLSAGQDVIVSGGIQGLKRGRVEAGRDMRARFIENAQVTAERHVLAGSVLHSQVECRGRIEVTMGKGLIAGGSVRAGEAVLAKTIGTPLATPTEIQVGTDPAVRKELARASDDFKECQKQIAQMEASIESMRSLGSFKASSDHEAQIVRAQRRLRLLREHLSELEAQVKNLTEVIRTSDRGLVQAETVYPGVKITVGLSTLFVDETRRGLRLQPGSSELTREG